MLEIILFLYGIGKQLAVEWDVLKGLTEPTDASSSQHNLRHLLSLRHSADLGRKIFPTASLLRSGRLCLRESETMNPTAT